ncbi:hypothetical protein ABLN72_13135, partial [Mycobacterium tuberculosis]
RTSFSWKNLGVSNLTSIPTLHCFPNIVKHLSRFSCAALHATQVAARARDGGIPLTARMVFEHPVLCELAAAVDAKPHVEAEPDDKHHAPMSTSGLSPDELSALTASWDQWP